MCVGSPSVEEEDSGSNTVAQQSHKRQLSATADIEQRHHTSIMLSGCDQEEEDDTNKFVCAVVARECIKQNRFTPCSMTPSSSTAKRARISDATAAHTAPLPGSSDM